MDNFLLGLLTGGSLILANGKDLLEEVKVELGF